MKFEKIKKSSLPEIISEHIAQMVAEGALKPGDKLPSERELMEFFGVSRPSVREALHALAFSGILEIRSGSGTYLSSGENILNDKFTINALFNYYTSMELVEVRRIIEIESVELAVLRATKEEEREILLAAEKTLEYKGTGKRYVEADLKFHEAVIYASHNRFLVQLYDVARNMEKDPMYYHINQDPKMIEAATYHKTIADAIVLRNAKAAKEAMATHFDLLQSAISEYGQ